MPDTELTAAYEAHFERLCAVLKRKFPRLDQSDCEDLVQLAFTETLERIRSAGFRPNKDWPSYLRWLTTKRALDYLRCHELASLEALAGSQSDSSCGGWCFPDVRTTPIQIVLEAERRGRQTLIFSEVLKEYCRRCEEHPKMLTQKEVYERALRGHKPAQIAAAMDMDRDSVDVHLSRARKWILDRVRAADVHRSVFLTLHRIKPET